MALLGLGTIGALAVYLLLIAFVPGASGTRLDAMKTALLVVAGSGAGAGLYVQYRKQQTDEAKSALDHANSRRDQDKLFTERYTQAVAQLGSSAAAVRLGGVYALARIADDSGRDRPTCLKVLCAYLRMPYDTDDPAKADEREVRITAQVVLAERLHTDHSGFWAGAEIDLRGAHLIDFDLSGATVAVVRADRATFAGDARFDTAIFSRLAVFDTATFSGVARFDGATFSQVARFDGATFNQDARFTSATFSGVTIFNEAVFSGDYAEFTRVKFSQDAWFHKAKFGGVARFGRASLGRGPRGTGSPGTAFGGDAWFTGAMFSQDAGFGEATFSGGASFTEATFSRRAIFKNATFSWKAEFGKARFRRDHPPVWPKGFAEPAGIVWQPVDPPAPAPSTLPEPDPGPLLIP